MQIYYAIVHQEDDSAFGISFPDVPGCFSASDEENEVVKHAQEALALYAADLEALPTARSLQDIRLDAEVRADLAQGAFIIAVPLIEIDHKARYNLMLDAALVAGVDTIAKTVGISRSEFVSDTIQRRLEAEVGAVVIKRAVKLTGSGSSRPAAAARVLADPAATRSEKKAAASALTQAGGASEVTGAGAAKAASKVLRDPKSSKDAKSAAASALTQKVKAKAKAKKK